MHKTQQTASEPQSGKSLRRLSVVFALFAGLAMSSMGRAETVVVFGDSLSDTGNLASVTGAFPNPPFAGNRVSNGDTAVTRQ